MAAYRRRKIGHRRRVEDEGDDEGGPDALDLDDDSLSDGSLVTDDNDHGDDSDTSNVDETSPTAPNGKKKPNGNGKPSIDPPSSQKPPKPNGKQVTDTDLMLHGLSISEQPAPPQEMHFDEVAQPAGRRSPNAPVVVSSASAVRETSEQPGGRRRQEHEDYKRRRDEDPAFVPNRGSFFMHDHRHPGPAGNGFRPFGRGRGRGGRGGIGGPYAPMSHIHHPSDPTTNSPWTHDMHEAVADPGPRRPRPGPPSHVPPVHHSGYIPTCEPSKDPINRTLSTEKHIGNAQVRVMLPLFKGPIVLPAMPVKQYTKLPDHRPPLRRDKPVRISLPDHNPKYIYPATDRSFIFIPRAMRPNQQRVRGKGPRSAFGSVGGYSRRTSVYGGSYYGSMYSPSIALSRRSSVVHERDYMFSPTGSVVSRPAVPVEPSRPVVRLPPSAQSNAHSGPSADMSGQPLPVDGGAVQTQSHPVMHKTVFQESQASQIPMHQPRPQKNISVADIDSPQLSQGPQAFHGAFHQQVPPQIGNGLPKENHQRQLSYPSQHSTGTPLSQIPERAIHAAPFQPHTFGQPQGPMHQHAHYYPPQQPGYPPQPQQQQHDYYYPPGYGGPPAMPQGQAPGYAPPVQQPDAPNGQGPPGGAYPVAQEVNGMVYYYDASQMTQPVNQYSSYPASQPYQPSVMGMGGMVTPSPDGYYYPQGGPPAPGMVYYPQ
ncbi:CASC3/Barentsz eIF4AIII binding domain-containing protein [Sarocladium implicatum]|nr:CASC3/Barentsz eIF4AIII binding domain-containing protein [Sarocladium implicatum]